MRLVEQFSDKIDHDLKPVSGIEAFYEMTREHRQQDAGSGLWQLSRQPEYYACVLAALGRLDEAGRAAVECLVSKVGWQKALDKGHTLLARRVNNSEGKYLVSMAAHRLALLAEMQRLADLSNGGDRAGVAALLCEWEQQKIKHWKIEALWQPTPFPIELGAGLTASPGVC